MPPWKRTYWAVWTANLITAIGMMSFLPFFPSHLETLGVTDREEVAAWAGVIFGAAPFVAALMGPVWGALGDRIGRRFMVARAMAGITVFVGGMAFAQTPLQLLLLRLGQGFFSGFVAPSVTLVSVVAPEREQGRVTGSLQTALALGAVIGPALGGLVGPAIGLRALFGAVAVASVVSAVLVLTLAYEDPGTRQAGVPGAGARAFLAGLAGDMVGVWRNPRVRGALILLFWVQFGMGATTPLLELFVGDLIGDSGPAAARWTGGLFSVAAVVNIVALPRWGSFGDRRGHVRGLTLCAGLTAAALALHAAVSWLPLLYVARVLLALGVAGAGPLAFGLAAEEVPVERRGSAFGAVFSARTLAVSVSAGLGGWLSRFVGIRGLFVVGAALVVAALASLRPRAERAAPAPGAASRPGGAPPPGG